jgi:hypothetical protein
MSPSAEFAGIRIKRGKRLASRGQKAAASRGMTSIVAMDEQPTDRKFGIRQVHITECHQFANAIGFQYRDEGLAQEV